MALVEDGFEADASEVEEIVLAAFVDVIEVGAFAAELDFVGQGRDESEFQQSAQRKPGAFGGSGFLCSLWCAERASSAAWSGEVKSRRNRQDKSQIRIAFLQGKFIEIQKSSASTRKLARILDRVEKLLGSGCEPGVFYRVELKNLQKDEAQDADGPGVPGEVLELGFFEHFDE